jgi:hypothetical protein
LKLQYDDTLSKFAFNFNLRHYTVVGLPLAQDPAHWHNMFLLAAVPALLQGALMSVVPESPSWLRRKAGAYTRPLLSST